MAARTAVGRSREALSSRVEVWDLPTRLFHAGLMLAVLVAWLSGTRGRMDVHFLAGYAVLVLLLFRLAWGLVGSTTARFRQFVRGPRAVWRYLRSLPAGGCGAATLGHNPAGGWMVVAMLLGLAAQAGTGLFTSDDIMVDGPAVKLASSAVIAAASSVHRQLADAILVLVGLHVAAILAYRLLRGEDLITPMVNGRKEAGPAGPAAAPRLVHAGWALLVLLVAVTVVAGALYRLG